jgi:hypothetical protein
MDENKLRAKALEFLDGQHVQDQQFEARIKNHLQEIPVSRVGLQYCPACESALCGVCGKCHELDHEILFVGPHCPLAVETSGMSPCVAWSWAYIFLRRAEKALSV